MAVKKGPKMIEDLVRQRASGAGFQTIASDLGISRNTVKCKLKDLGAYAVDEAMELLAAGFSSKLVSCFFAPHLEHQDHLGRVIGRGRGWDAHKGALGNTLKRVRFSGPSKCSL